MNYKIDDTDFEEWWYLVGSSLLPGGDDNYQTHAKKVCKSFLKWVKWKQNVMIKGHDEYKDEELSIEAKQAIRWLNSSKAENLTVKEAREFIRMNWSEAVQIEIKEYVK